MSDVPANLKYTRSHEWVRMEEDGSAVVGITDHAQEQLGDLVFVELPDVGRKVAAGEDCAVVESVKAASDVYAPLAGEVAEVNGELEGAPELVNQEPYGRGWLFRLKDVDAASAELLDAEAYRAHVESGEH